MKTIALLWVELRRMFRSKLCLSVALLGLLAPLFGYEIYIQSSSVVISGKYLANPVLAGAAIGAVLFAVLSLIEADRIHRTRIDIILDSAVSPVKMESARVLATLCFATIIGIICALCYLPYTMFKLDYIFNAADYLASYAILLIPTWWISILLVSALYQITRRVEIAGLLYGGMVFLCYTPYVQSDYLARWINPFIATYSDGFSNAQTLRTALYTRLVWLLIAGGLCFFSLVCTRRYGKKLPGSLWRGVRKLVLPIVAVVLVGAGTWLWAVQPIVDHGPAEWIDSDEILYSNTACTDVTYRLTASPRTGALRGVLEYTIRDSWGDSEDSVWLNSGYKVVRLTYGTEDIAFQTLNNDTNGARQTVFTLPQGRNQVLTLEYEGIPSIAKCFVTGPQSDEITWESISLLNEAAWPNASFAYFTPNFSIEMTIPDALTPIVNHKFLEQYTENEDGTRTWKAQVTSFPNWITACDYKVLSFQAAGVDVDLVYSSKYDENMKKYQIPEAITDVMNYCSSHLGKLKSTTNGSLLMVERTANNGGGNAVEGSVEWSETMFTAENLSDPLKGAGAAEVFAHEIIHQWWGMGVDFGYDEGIWSNEGLTVYTTYRLMKEKYGELYAQKNYVDVWQANVDKQNRSFYYRHPEYLDLLPEQYRGQLAMEFEEIDRYCRMPLMLLKAEKLVGGEEAMDRILQSIQAEYFWNEDLTYEAFLNICGLQKEELELE